MRWTEHQQALLREIGIRLWLPPDVSAGSPGSVLVPELHEPVVVPALAPTSTSASTTLARPAVVGADAVPVAAPAGRPKVMPPVVAASSDSGFFRATQRPTGVAALDWPELRAAVQGCQACRLCESRTQTVFGVGNTRAHWMLVGEAPGEQEDRQGEPFVGKAGQLLDQMLRAVGLTREEAPPERQVFIANVLKCRPPGNRNPDPQEVAKCEPFLQRQVELVQPRLILAMGRFAVQSLLQSAEPIGRLRGRVHQYHGVPVVVTYHPAYLLRNPLDKSRAWEDLCLAREVLAGAAPG